MVEIHEFKKNLNSQNLNSPSQILATVRMLLCSTPETGMHATKLIMIGCSICYFLHFESLLKSSETLVNE